MAFTELRQKLEELYQRYNRPEYISPRKKAVGCRP
jgi:hypothetical protein